MFFPVSIFRSRYGEFQAGEQIGPINWDHHDLLYSHSGTLEITFPLSNKKVLLIPESCILIYPETEFMIKPLPGSSGIRASTQYFRILSKTGSDLVFPWSFLGSRKNYYIHFPESSTLEIRSLIEEANIYDDISRQNPLYQYRLQILGMIMWKLLLTLKSDPEEITETLYIHRVRILLQENPPEELNPGLIAGECGMSLSHFRSEFRKHFGTPIATYLRDFKLYKASQQLAQTLLSIKEITAYAGYSEPAHFYRAFRKKFGIPPGEYRKKNRTVG